MTADESLTERTAHLLNTARYLNLATARDGLPWVATLEYAWFTDPLHFVFGSSTGSRHSGDLRAEPRVSGSLFVTAGAAGVAVASVDGAQFTGRCAEIGPELLDAYYAPFYETVFPDARQRAEWRLPPERLRGSAPHRLYRVDVERWWLIDTRHWEEDRIDRRVELPLDSGTQARLAAHARVRVTSP
ncbi:pyridoxamine 5'-phosphate oxidase family protein [Streptomyces sp. NRRL S-31]|uniref:pyridoxamine 5'-phosphate oxidase family protein n=1 Tax=Streptomyces sp. NRRL S-31 TaxID=1463898 RepID=UPI00069C58D7|nr:pyridoxamine 5'-phosphate oxidase family protein [Streptomyces sp. NRRL S-31]